MKSGQQLNKTNFPRSKKMKNIRIVAMLLLLAGTFCTHANNDIDQDLPLTVIHNFCIVTPCPNSNTCHNHATHDIEMVTVQQGTKVWDISKEEYERLTQKPLANN